jgi:ArsR family transcriptional regulator
MILRLLEFREMCVCEVMVALGLNSAYCFSSLGNLENVGLIKSRKKAKWVFYNIADPKLIEAMHQLNFF